MAASLQGSARPLTVEHDVALLDLDGVVYVGAQAVPGAPEALSTARAQGMRLAFVTNNAARPPHAVADHLTELGIAARSNEVVTSAQAAARYLADRLPGGAAVLVVGTTGLDEALRERGLKPVADANGQVDAVVQGYSPELSWRQLAEGAVAINRGVLWVATNVDRTVPSARGPLPGNGSLVAALRWATGAHPIVTGKPDPTMHRESVLRTRAERPIVVGDRLDTDIEGANAVGCRSLLVLTGVTTVPDLLAAEPKMRPTFVSADLNGLLTTHQAPEWVDGAVRCGSWLVRTKDTTLTLSRVRREPGDAEGGHEASIEVRGLSAEDSCADVPPSQPIDGPAFDDDALDAIRALCAAAWALADSVRPGSVPRRVSASDGTADVDVNQSADSGEAGSSVAVAETSGSAVHIDVGVQRPVSPRIDAAADEAAELMLARLGVSVSRRVGLASPEARSGDGL